VCPLRFGHALWSWVFGLGLCSSVLVFVLCSVSVSLFGRFT
jgi:hypothetical protein